MERRSLAAGMLETSCPLISTVPDVGSTMRLSMRREVVLPQPEGPTKTVREPAGMSRSRWSTAVVPSG